MGVRIKSVWGIRIRGRWNALVPPPNLTPQMTAIIAKAERNDPTWRTDAQAIDVDLGCVLIAGLDVVESGAA
jgi:hypothetical protein